MTRMGRFISLIAATWALSSASAPDADAGAVELRAAARVGVGAPITLGDVANLEGEDALALADVVLLEQSAGAWAEIDLETVRRKLRERGVNWGRLALRGSTCSVRLGEVAPAPEAPRREPTPAAMPMVVDTAGVVTARKRLARTLATHYGAPEADLQLLFDARDDAFLDRAEPARRIEVHPEASANSGRMPVTVRIYDGMRIVAERTVQVDVRVRRPALVLTADLRRGDAITPAHLREEILWLAPGPMHLSAADGVVGSKARTRLGAGTTLRADHIESPVVVRRNELVTVKCLSGSVVLTAKARAGAEARIGDIIEMRLDGAARTFLARVDGPGRAVANLEGGQAPAASEAQEELER